MVVRRDSDSHNIIIKILVLFWQSTMVFSVWPAFGGILLTFIGSHGLSLGNAIRVRKPWIPERSFLIESAGPKRSKKCIPEGVEGTWGGTKTQNVPSAE